MVSTVAVCEGEELYVACGAASEGTPITTIFILIDGKCLQVI